ncbi:MAG: TusE/DsrC/DsvC family sulfur relay protein, partial [Pseudomonadota bacterium]
MDIALDSEGFLLDRDNWTEEVARELAGQDGFEMTDEVMGYINAARDMFEEDAVVPPIRKFAKKMGVDSKHLYNVF